MPEKNPYIVPSGYEVSQKKRADFHGHKPLLVWFTGLSGSGKSTVANTLEMLLHREGINTYHLDGDNLRKGLNQDLGFSAEDRGENIRRIAEVARLFVESGTVVTAAFISPFEKDREMVKETVGREFVFEVFVDCPLEICESRDVKGLYALARKGVIKDFTGIGSPYELPAKPDMVIKTHLNSAEDCAQLVLKKVLQLIKLPQKNK